MTTAVAWVGLGAAFGKPYMEAILTCRVPRKLNTIWYTTFKLNTVRADSSQEISVKYRNMDKESVFIEVLLLHKYPFF